MFSGFGFKPPASGFQSYSYSSLKPSPPPFKDNGLPFWVSFIVENLFSLNLHVFSSVLYGWRSLEATVRIRLKNRGRRLKSKT